MLVYAVSVNESRRAGSIEIMEAISSGRAAGTTSPAVIEEVWHLEASGRVPGLKGQAKRAYEILRPLLPVDDQVLDLAFDLGLSDDAALGANDRVHAATCRRYGIEAIVSADRGFDAVDGLHRVDPIDAKALEDLW